MDYFVSFSEGIADPAIVGGKASNIIKLKQIGVNVPPGFVINAYSFQKFLEESENGQQIKELLAVDLSIKKVFHLSKLIKQAFRASKISKKLKKEFKKGFKKLKMESGKGVSFAVRSSATIEDTETFSFAGQAKTYLHNKSFKDILLSVKKCWASIYNPSALLYIIQMNKRGKKISLNELQMAVVVQKMVNSDISGVLYTANVINNNLEEMMINSTWGLGETIANNTVNPDMIILNKNKFEIIKSVIGTKEKQSIQNPHNSHTILIDTDPKYKNICSLNENQLQQLYKLGLKLEKALKFPQDIEWAIENDIIYTLQSRPITTLNK
jgi:phosphoenolpyruvate synthase/pyruvate phosphate dikinase